MYYDGVTCGQPIEDYDGPGRRAMSKTGDIKARTPAINCMTCFAGTHSRARPHCTPWHMARVHTSPAGRTGRHVARGSTRSAWCCALPLPPLPPTGTGTHERHEGGSQQQDHGAGGQHTPTTRCAPTCEPSRAACTPAPCLPTCEHRPPAHPPVLLRTHMHPVHSHMQRPHARAHTHARTPARPPLTAATHLARAGAPYAARRTPPASRVGGSPQDPHTCH